MEPTRSLTEKEKTEIAKMLIEGKDRSNIKAHIISLLQSTHFDADRILTDIAESWNVGLPAVDSLIESAFASFDVIEDDSRRNEMLLAYARLTDLYSLSYSNKDYRECREIQREINKLLGLNAPERSEIKSDVQTEFKVTVVNKPKEPSND
jgi:hypothetical protein